MSGPASLPPRQGQAVHPGYDDSYVCHGPVLSGSGQRRDLLLRRLRRQGKGDVRHSSGSTAQRCQLQYYTQSGKYAGKIEELGPSGAGLISAELASGTKNGYRFTLAGDGKTYAIHADPVEGAKDRRFFFRREHGDPPKPWSASHGPQFGSGVMR